MNIDAHELKALADSFKDTNKLVIVTEIALHNASQVVIDGVVGGGNHIFKNQKHILEKSVDSNVKGLSSEIFTPIDGNLGIPYAGWINEGKRKTKTGKTAIWNNGKGDPYIENSFKRNSKNFLKTMHDDLTEAIQDSL